MDPIDLLKFHWYVVPNHAVGGWAISTSDSPVGLQPAGLVNGYVVADFIDKACAEHVVLLHSAWRLRQL